MYVLYNKVDERVINLLYKKVQLEYCREEEENREGPRVWKTKREGKATGAAMHMW